MDVLENRIALAKQDRRELDQFIKDYLPFLKKQVSSLPSVPMEYEDMLSIAMLTFAGCVQQYQPEKGGFLGFAQTCIRNRLIDEGRKNARQSTHLIPLYSEEQTLALAETASLQQYDRDQEREALCAEIDGLAACLQPFGVTFAELTKICPRQRRARQQCVAFASFVAQSPALHHKLLFQHRLPQKELAEAFGVSVKTIEKHRKYIIALTMLLLGDYPYICAFLPQDQEVKL